MGFSENLRRLREAAGLTQEQLTNACGFPTQSRIANYEAQPKDGRKAREPKFKDLKIIADVLGVTKEELLSEDISPLHKDGRQGIVNSSQVPLIGWVQAGRWTQVEEHFAPGQYEKVVLTTARVSKDAFALRVEGDSMVNPKNDLRSFPQGTEIIVDPHRQAENGSLVIVTLDENPKATFKKLLIEGDRKFLIPLNPQHPTLPVDKPMHICGVVVAKAEQLIEPE